MDYTAFHTMVRALLSMKVQKGINTRKSAAIAKY